MPSTLSDALLTIQIFEQSNLATETGAAIHLAPNSNGLLRRLGIFAEEFGANLMERVNFVLADSMGRFVANVCPGSGVYRYG